MIIARFVKYKHARDIVRLDCWLILFDLNIIITINYFWSWQCFSTLQWVPPSEVYIVQVVYMGAKWQILCGRSFNALDLGKAAGKNRFCADASRESLRGPWEKRVARVRDQDLTRCDSPNCSPPLLPRHQKWRL